MDSTTLHIKNPSPKLLEFLREQREKKEQRKQELLRVAELLFDTKECSLCEQDQPQT